MTNDNAVSIDAVEASVIKGSNVSNRSSAGGVYTIQCFDKDGNLKWEDTAHNLVVNEGLKNMNDKYFTGSSYTAAWYLGLITGPGSGTTYSASDTLGSNIGWTEFTNYTGTRGAIPFSAASLADPSVITNGTVVQFNITGAGGTIAGAFLCTAASGTSGTLFSESDFQTPGDRVVVLGDAVNVTYSFSLDAA